MRPSRVTAIAGRPLVVVLPLVLAAAAGLAQPASAAEYYFSDCASGGAGTRANPFCLDPGGNGGNDSFAFLADGSGPDLAPGDVVNLCAGPCDGTGTAVYRVTPSGGAAPCDGTFFIPRVSGTSSSPITIRTYPGETVTLDVSDGQRMFSNPSARSWYRLQGIGFRRSRQEMFCFREAGAPHWVVDGATISEVDARTWGTQGGIANGGCTDAAEGSGYAFRIANQTGSFTLRNSKLHTICKSAMRILTNADPSASFLFENNEYWNVSTAVETFNTHHMTVRGNRIHDAGVGVAIENQAHHIVVEDNSIACLGDYVTSTDGRCPGGIKINEGDLGSAYHGMAHDITVRRNTLYATNVGGASPYTRRGMFLGGISDVASCDSSRGCDQPNVTIENNMLWGIKTFFGHQQTVGAIDVRVNKPITVQNNTVYDVKYGSHLEGAAHNFRNNVIARCSGDCVYVYSGGTSGIAYNNISTSGNAVVASGNTWSCGTLAAGLGQGNRCATPSFANTSGSVAGWDLHLASSDSGCRDQGDRGSAEDIDRGARAAPVDIGADEYGSDARPVSLTAVLSITPAPPAAGGIPLLRAAPWIVILGASRELSTIPSGLRFVDALNRSTTIPLAGPVPGASFTGTFLVDSGIANGSGTFRLDTAALVDGLGNIGQEITSGAKATIDRTAPGSPARILAR